MSAVRLRGLQLMVLAGCLISNSAGAARVLKVGPGQAYLTIVEASFAAQDGDTVEIEAGRYRADVAVWKQKSLKIIGVHGRAVLSADGRAAEGKAIWVFRDGNFVVENIEFSGANVPDQNGAGIRFEKGSLIVRNCAFLHNQEGILVGNDKQSEVEIEGSEFGYNGDGVGQSHNLYVGSIKRLKVTGSYFHHAIGGHLLKSRAMENHIFYNRLTDEIAGQASYELELANGGVSYVVGNIIEQSSTTENPHMISYGTEGYAWPRNELYLINNTLVDDKPSNGIFLRVKPGVQIVKALNNLLIGKGQLDSAAAGDFRANVHGDWTDLALAVRYDYRLKLGSTLVGKAVDPGVANGVRLTPDKEYAHPTSLRPVPFASPGAMQTLVP